MITSFQLTGTWHFYGKRFVPTYLSLSIASFGDTRTKDKSVFPLHDPNANVQGLKGFEQVRSTVHPSRLWSNLSNHSAFSPTPIGHLMTGNRDLPSRCAYAQLFWTYKLRATHRSACLPVVIYADSLAHPRIHTSQRRRSSTRSVTGRLSGSHSVNRFHFDINPFVLVLCAAEAIIFL